MLPQDRPVPTVTGRGLENAPVSPKQSSPSPPSLAGAFSLALARLGPFEPSPSLVVAVSGGADSMALCLLAHDWARRRGGRVIGLTVDHRLRAESRAEARRVGRWLAARGIAHHILTWRRPAGGRHPAGGASGSGQQAYRTARYRLLEGWCRERGLPHLLLGHHRGDQAETVLLRKERGSRPHGLAAMASLRETAHVRLLRPLLGIDPVLLREELKRRGQPWVEDPSNRDLAYARSRLRLAPGRILACPTHQAEAHQTGGSGPEEVSFLAEQALILGHQRARDDRLLATLMARIVFPHPAGFVWLDCKGLVGADSITGERLLGRVLATVGGSVHPPRGARLSRLLDALADMVSEEMAGEEMVGETARATGRKSACDREGAQGRIRPGSRAGGHGRTLGGCRVLFHGGNRLLICREAGRIAGPEAVTGPGWRVWDRRFLLRVSGRADGGATFWLGPLGVGGIAAVRALGGLASRRLEALPAAVRPGLPALFDGSMPVSVPHVGLDRPNAARTGLRLSVCRPCPPVPLAGPPFLPGGKA